MTEHSNICLAPALAQLRVDHAAQAQRVQRLQQQVQMHVATINSQREELIKQRQHVWDADARVLVKIEANLAAAEMREASDAAEAVTAAAAVTSTPPSPTALIATRLPAAAASPFCQRAPSSARRSVPLGSAEAAAVSIAATSTSAVPAAASAVPSRSSSPQPADVPTRHKCQSAPLTDAPAFAGAAPAPAELRRPAAMAPLAKRRKHSQTAAAECRQEEGEQQRELHQATALSSAAAVAAATAAAATGVSNPSPVTSRFGRIRVPFHKDAEYIAAISKPPAAVAAAAAAATASSKPPAASAHFLVCKSPAASTMAPMRLGGVDHAVHMINGHHWFNWAELHATLVRVGLLTPHPPADESLHLVSTSGAMQWLEYYERHFFPARSRWAHTEHHDFSLHGYEYGRYFSKDVCVTGGGVPFLCVHGLAGIALMDHASDEELARLQPRIDEWTRAFRHVLDADKEIIRAEIEAEKARKAAKTARKTGATVAASTAAPATAAAATPSAVAGPT